MKRLMLALAAVAAGMALSAVPASAQKTYTMKIGFATINDSQHYVANWMQKEFERRSDGRIEVKVYPAGQLGKIARQIEGIQLGTQEVYSGPPGFFIGLNRAFMVTDAPGLFDGIMHQSRAVNYEPFREKFLRLGEDKGVVGNTIFSCGDTAVNTIKPFEKLADIQGAKIRVLATPLERAVMEAMGASGVPMPYTEVLPAMQRGVIDGVRTGIIVMYPSKFYTVAKHVTLTATAHIACAQWLSKSWLKSLPEDLRQLVRDVGREVTPMAAMWGEQMTRQAERDWEKEGTLHGLPEDEQKQLLERVSTIGDKILGNDPKTKDMYALLKQAAEATRSDWKLK